MTLKAAIARVINPLYDEISRKIRALREEASLSQRQLAKLVGTKASVICQLEDGDYEEHSLSMLNRIAASLKTAS